jgi:hypothetical protein
MSKFQLRLFSPQAFVIARDGTEWGRQEVFGHGKNLESLIEHTTNIQYQHAPTASNPSTNTDRTAPLPLICPNDGPAALVGPADASVGSSLAAVTFAPLSC